MGGSNSGWYGRRSPRQRVEDLHPLSVASFSRGGVLGHPATATSISFWIRNETIRLRFEATRQPFGGWRWWLVCPGCGSRRAKLYLREWARVSCRACLGLHYTSQSLSMPDRWRHHASVLFRRAGCHVSDDFYHKPKWMRWAMFNRLIDEAEDLENASIGYHMLPFLRMARRHGLAT
jgi:hypothetical protein